MNTQRLKSQLKQVLPVGMSVFILDTLAGDLPIQQKISKPVRRAVGKLSYGDDSAFAGGALNPKRAIVTDRFDCWAEQRAALEYATGVFDSATIPYALMPGRYGQKTVVLRAADKARAILSLSNNSTSNEAWHLTPLRKSRVALKHAIDLSEFASKQTGRATAEKHAEFVLFNHKIATSGRVLGNPRYGVSLSFWQEQLDDLTPRPDGYTYETGTLMAPRQNGIAAYLSPSAWERAVASPTKWPENVSHPHIYQITEPIDVVYTWVDGDDPEWQRRKNAALGKTDTTALNETSANASRYASRDELKYSLRSLETYANWIRNIYIVTDDQVPSWLDTSNPRIRVVSHREIFTDPSVLPVFNSHAIESQLHHIEGLSNQFLYMNDDVLFGNLVQAADFFHSSRLSKYFPSKACLDVDPPSARDMPVLSSAKNARQLIADEFGVTITNKFKHTPMPLQRDVLYEMEERFGELFKTVAASKFRHPQDYSIASGFYHYYAFATGRAVPGSISYGYQDISRPDLPIFLKQLSNKNPYRVFCLNDTDSTPEQIAALTGTIIDTMQKCYPLKSSFEKGD